MEAAAGSDEERGEAKGTRMSSGGSISLCQGFTSSRTTRRTKVVMIRLLNLASCVLLLYFIDPCAWQPIVEWFVRVSSARLQVVSYDTMTKLRLLYPIPVFLVSLLE